MTTGTKLIMFMATWLTVALIVATCETQPPPQQPPPFDSVATRTIDSLTLQISAWENVVTLNHLNNERLTANVESLIFDLEAERKHNAEMQGKYQERLDSAVKVIERQAEQLRYCKCSPEKP